MSKEDDIRAEMGRIFGALPERPEQQPQDYRAFLIERMESISGVPGWTAKLSEDGKVVEMKPPPGYTIVYGEGATWSLGTLDPSKLCFSFAETARFPIEDAGPHPKDSDEVV